MFKHYFLDKKTTEYKHLFSGREYQILMDSLRSTYRMK